MKSSSPKRLDLQGLRAWAVVAVIAFHFFPALLPFGYLGVDVFFVLSGFLISLVLSKASATVFSTYTSFYFKRVRRIFPLLLLIVAVLIAYIVVHYEDKLLFYNSRSAAFALLFISNIRAQDKGEDYFRMLEKSTDLFTHTRSLAVEVQFYLLAPILIHLSKFCLGSFSILYLPLLSLISSFSLVYHGYSPSNVAFNSALARLWQFLAGAIVFHMQDSWSEIATTRVATIRGETNKLLNEAEKGEREEGVPPPICRLAPALSYSLSAAFFAFAFIVLWDDLTMVFLTRVAVTYSTALIILAQMNTPLLTHSLVVALGNASYALYLVHWPVVCILAEYQITSPWAKVSAILLCFLVSFVIERFYESWYLHLDESSTLLLVLALYSLSFGALVAGKFTKGEGGVPLDLPHLLPRLTNPSCLSSTDVVTQLQKEWDMETTRNISIADAMALNFNYDSAFLENLVVNNCSMRKASEKNLWGLCDMPPGKGKLKFLTVGNSFAANHVGLIYKHFAHRFSTFQQHSVISERGRAEVVPGMVEIIAYVAVEVEDVAMMNAITSTMSVTTSASGSCQFLNPQGACKGNATMLEKDVETEKPDVLFIIQRWFDLATPIKDINNLDGDKQFTAILQNLNRIGQNVSKVFVMNSFPLTGNVRSAMRSRLSKNQDIPDYLPEVIEADDKWLRLRLEGIAKRCRNCVLFDLKKRHLNDKGEYTVVHPHTHITYFEMVQHHTPYGLRLVEPVFAGMARDFDMLMASKWPDNMYS